MKLVRFYSEGELSSIRVTNEDEAVAGVKNLLFDEQLAEEQIMLEIFSQNHGNISDVDELRLDFDRLFTKKQLLKKGFLTACKLVDSSHHNEDFSMATIISIKNEQRYLSAIFKSFVVLIPRTKLVKSPSEPLLFASLKNDNYYLVNQEQSIEDPSAIKKFNNWIRKKISSKTSSK